MFLTVVYIKLGRDGRATEFDERVNIKHVFGPYAMLLDRNLEEVPLRITGEPLEDLHENELYLVEINGLGYGNKLVKEVKKQFREQMKQKQQSTEMTSVESPEVKKLQAERKKLKGRQS